MLKEQFEKAKGFVKDHKTEIAICVGTVVGGAVVWKIMKDVTVGSGSVVKELKIEIPKYVKENIPNGLEGIVTDISHPESVTDWTDVWIENAKLSDLGEFGQKLSELEGFDMDSYVGGVVSLSKTPHDFSKLLG